MATIKDIATRLGVSVSTVSKGLNGASDISEELRQMVLDTAVEMGYATKKSKKKENRKLAVFIENMEYETEDQFGYDIVLGFKQNAFRHNWDVTVIPVTPAFQLTEKYDTYMLKNGFCGAFLVGFALHDEWMQQLSHTTIHDRPLFRKRRGLPQNDERHHRRLCLRHCDRCGRYHAAPQQTLEKEGGIP